MKRHDRRHHGSNPTRGSPPASSMAFPVVAVGASAGGMEAFVELLRHIPHDSGMAFVLIQHLHPTHPSHLRDLLARSTSVPVHEIEDRMRVEPDHVYVIPPNADVGILQGTLTLVPRSTDPHRPHRPIDFFFTALAADQANPPVGVVLSGTGSDGAEGLRAIKAEGGITFVQDPRSAKFDGMPRAAIQSGVADFVLPIAELAAELPRIARHPLLAAQGDPGALAGPSQDGELEQVLAVLREVVGVDFAEYTHTGILRRLVRRMAMHRLTTLREYVQVLRDDRAEALALVEDILIHVTSFFRDARVYDRLGERVFPEILNQRRRGGTIRMWSAGCSTGEEAYSLVICLLEFLDREGASDVPIQLFGTDISERAIEVARAGFYSETAVRDVGPDRLARFFTPVDGGGYRISKLVRDRCLFAKHDLAHDPPYPKLDLVSCRNVLIYFAPELQKRVLGALHFALNYPGFLLLGRSETVTDGASLFSTIDQEARIFARATATSALHIAPAPDMAAMANPGLAAAKAYLQSIIDEHQRTNDELMAANEQLVATNEELQSLNEELQTAKEELQSTNEELFTLNEEAQTRNAELDAVNSDLLNVLGSVEVPIVIVDKSRRIRRFTPKARSILNLIPADVGRPIDDIKPIVAIAQLDHKIASVIDTVMPHEEEVRGRNGEWYRLQIRPYATADRKIDGAVISVIDIDVLKRALGAAEWARDYATAMVEAVRMPLLLLDMRHDVVSMNQAFRDHFRASRAELEGKSVYALLNGAWDVAALRSALPRVLEADEGFEDLEVERELPGLGPRTLFMSGRGVVMPGGAKLVLLAVEDVTDRRHAEADRPPMQ